MPEYADPEVRQPVLPRYKEAVKINPPLTDDEFDKFIVEENSPLIAPHCLPIADTMYWEKCRELYNMDREVEQMFAKLEDTLLQGGYYEGDPADHITAVVDLTESYLANVLTPEQVKRLHQIDTIYELVRQEVVDGCRITPPNQDQGFIDHFMIDMRDGVKSTLIENRLLMDAQREEAAKRQAEVAAKAAKDAEMPDVLIDERPAPDHEQVGEEEVAQLSEIGQDASDLADAHTAGSDTAPADQAEPMDGSAGEPSPANDDEPKEGRQQQPIGVDISGDQVSVTVPNPADAADLKAINDEVMRIVQSAKALSDGEARTFNSASLAEAMQGLSDRPGVKVTSSNAAAHEPMSEKAAPGARNGPAPQGEANLVPPQNPNGGGGAAAGYSPSGLERLIGGGFSAIGGAAHALVTGHRKVMSGFNERADSRAAMALGQSEKLVTLSNEFKEQADAFIAAPATDEKAKETIGRELQATAIRLQNQYPAAVEAHDLMREVDKPVAKANIAKAMDQFKESTADLSKYASSMNEDERIAEIAKMIVQLLNRIFSKLSSRFSLPGFSLGEGPARQSAEAPEQQVPVNGWESGISAAEQAEPASAAPTYEATAPSTPPPDLGAPMPTPEPARSSGPRM